MMTDVVVVSFFLCLCVVLVGFCKFDEWFLGIMYDSGSCKER